MFKTIHDIGDIYGGAQEAVAGCLLSDLVTCMPLYVASKAMLKMPESNIFT